MRFLLVEDSRMLRERIRCMIEALPGAVTVAEADSEADAVAHLDAWRPDTVVLDLRLRSGSGLSVLKYVKDHHPDVIAIVLTNSCHPEYRTKCLALGADFFFDKSHDIEDFRLLLDKLEPCASPSVIEELGKAVGE